MYVDLLPSPQLPIMSSSRAHFINLISYFVTELLGTDLHRLLTSRPLEKQFIQYFLYQILVRPHHTPPGPETCRTDGPFLARIEIRALCRRRPPRSQAQQYPRE